MSNYRSAGDTNNLTRAIELADAISETALLGEAYRQLGLYYINNGETTLGIRKLIRALEAFERVGDTVGMAKANINLGFVHYGLAEIDLALEYSEEGLALARKVGDSLMLSIILGNIGSMYEKQPNGMDKALAAHLESMRLNTVLKDSLGMLSNYNNLGVLYEKNARPDRASIYYMQALELAVKLSIESEACRIRSNLASVHIQMKDFARAIGFLDASKLCDSLDMMLKLHRLDLRSTALAGLGHYKEAWENSVAYSELSDSLFRLDRVAIVNELSQKYESEKKQQQINLLEKDNLIHREIAKKETYRRNIFLLTTAFTLILLILLFTRYIEKGKLNRQLDSLNHQLMLSEHQLRALNSSKDKFFGILSHDLRNPLAAFEKLSENLKSKNCQDQSAIAMMMSEQAKNLSALLNNILVWSKAEQGLLKMCPQALLIHDLVEQEAQIFRPTLLERNTRLVNQIDADLLVYADKESLETILRNLIGNAVKFTQNGCIIIDSEQVKQYAVIHIKDDGIGMTEMQLRELFELSSKHQAGLGLLLCKELAERNRMQIEVASELGRGTCVTLKIPIFEPHEDRPD